MEIDVGLLYEPAQYREATDDDDQEDIDGDGEVRVEPEHDEILVARFRWRRAGLDVTAYAQLATQTAREEV